MKKQRQRFCDLLVSPGDSYCLRASGQTQTSIQSSLSAAWWLHSSHNYEKQRAIYTWKQICYKINRVW